MKIVGEENDTAKPNGAASDSIKPATSQSKEEAGAAENANAFDNPEEDTVTDGVDPESEESSRVPGAVASVPETKVNEEEYSREDLKITAKDKSAFIEAMLSGDRMRTEFSIFGGRVRGVIRSRTTDETNALYAYIRHTLKTGGEDGNSAIVQGDMSYIPLVAQIEEINGTKYPEMKLPLTYEESAGKVTEPGWMDDFRMWKAKPSALTSALINRLQLFEYKYWYMVKEANNKNFWNSDTSFAV